MKMKTTLGFLLVLTLTLNTALAGPRDEQWKKVQEAISKGLPKTAIEEIEPIIAGALRDKAYGEATKAIGMKIALEGNIHGNKAEEKITRMEAEIAKAPAEMKPVMEAILANWYWHYFLQNRWRFVQRTQTAEAPSKDFTTWDLPRILAEIDKQFTKALAHEKILKTTPVAAFDELLVKGSVPDSYRPTMFDFLAHNALEFYSAAEQGGAKAEDNFELTADSPIFASADEFLKWKPDTTDTESPTLKAVRLYQNLLAFHKDDKDKTAFIDADLWRLNFGNNRAVGDEKNDRYKAALKKFADDWGDHEISARALAYWAQVLQGESEFVEARKIAQRGLNAFPNSVGGAMCFNIIASIEAKSASIQTERVWNEPSPFIQVTYRNVTKVFFRAVAYDFDALIRNARWGWGNLDENLRRNILKIKPDLEWNADLPATSDFKQRVENLPAPKNLKPGFYFIIASHNTAFDGNDNQVTFAPVWVSDLAFVVRSRHYEGIVDGFVLDALSGSPIAGATVRSWERDNEGRLIPAGSVKTDGNGMFSFKANEQRGFFALASHGEHSLSTTNELWVGKYQEAQPHKQTVFFTDRSLYRPGQTIQYKGIAIRVDQRANNYETLAGENITIIFADPNGKEIARASHKTNDYGAFNGSFTAPRDRLMGRMTIYVASGQHGQTQISVEEYKRPKFQVELAAPKEAPKLNGEVVVGGKATAYTGAAIGGAKVKWRVVREVHFPPWCWWGYRYWWGGRQPSQAIAHGSAVTEADGSFTVKFTAKPDLSVSEKDEPTFQFTVYADVTDTTGETRSNQQRVRVGYTALQATMAANEWQTLEKKVEISIRTTSLDGEPQAAEGVVRIYRLKQPEKVTRPNLLPAYPQWMGRRGTGGTPAPPSETNPADPNTWELGDLVEETKFRTSDKEIVFANDLGGEVRVAAGTAKLEFFNRAGIYRAMLETKDRFGKTVTARLNIQVVDVKSKQFTVNIPNHLAAEKWSVEPGETFVGLWGTGYDKGRAFVELEHRGRLLRSFWTAADATQEVIEQAVAEEMRGGFTLRVTYIRENRAYLNERIVDVPWSNKQLTVKWEHFTSKLGPAQKETWTAVITRGDGLMVKGVDGLKGNAPFPHKPINPLPHVAEMVAGLYDASLDQYLPHNWMQSFNVFRREHQRVHAQFQNSALGFQHLAHQWHGRHRGVDFRYRTFPHEIAANLSGYGYFNDRQEMMKLGAPMPASAPAQRAQDSRDRAEVVQETAEGNKADGVGGAQDKTPPAPDLNKVTARKNLNETAFFFPHLISDKDGVVKMEFTMPEALTEWKFLGFAHDKDLRSGFITAKTVTAKDLMVEPNPPRFVREGDEIEFVVKITNQTNEPISGIARVTFADARTGEQMDAKLNSVPLGNIQGKSAYDQPFTIAAKSSRSYAWRIRIPDGCDFLTYKAVGATSSLSDGEEGYLPVLSRRILVIESLPLPIRGKQTKEFDFTKLRESGKSKTLRSENLTVQMVSQPAWYAVMALPYLMEYPHECSEQIFNRFYANSLARHIANSDPKIRRIFDQWKGTPALDSPLEKNQDLKSVMLEETPWLRQGVAESQARRNVGILFDANRLDEEMRRALHQLSEMQLSDGRFPWFPGMPPSDYITLYIVTGFGRLRHLVEAASPPLPDGAMRRDAASTIDVTLAKKALTALDAWMHDNYRRILDKQTYVPSATDAMYLYGRSFFLKDQEIAAQHREAVTYFIGQARKHWLKTDNRMTQAHIAIALARFEDWENRLRDKASEWKVSRDILKSLKERSVSNEEMGMFWRDTELSWWWYRAPIETQAMMIEAFEEVMGDKEAVEECRVWLLKQKQTQDWKTTKATADAIYGLLLRGTTNMLARDAVVEVSLGGKPIKPENVEAGTGFYEQRFVRSEIKPELGRITVKKTDEGVSWGSVHWQYLEDVSKVTPHEGTPLQLKKTLFVKETTKKGQVLRPVTGALSVGDELVVRIELRVDRDMEYVHLKDQRGSGTEPVNVLSRFKYQDGLGYYESTRDTASHFFIHYLPKGVYVFEYSVRVQHKGKYQSGIASIQCMYAPEFNSHSESFELEVK